MSQPGSTPFVESDHEFFELSGPLPTAWDENRRYPRFYFRTCAEAIIHPLRGGQDSTAAPCFLLTRDISRGGVGLVHSQQLFPGQRLDVVLNGELPRPVEVVWCRRWTHGRYVVGCRFVVALD
jgi:PilZ domain-containing protein